MPEAISMESSRAKHRAELVTDDRKALGEHLEVATGERVAALEALEPASGRATAPPGRGSRLREESQPESRPREAPEVSTDNTMEAGLEL